MTRRLPSEKPVSVPPAVAVKILEFVLPESVRQYLIGDLFEEYFEKSESSSGSSSAKIWFWTQTILQVAYWLCRGKPMLLASVLNTLFYAALSYVFISMTTVDFQFESLTLSGAGIICLILIAILISNSEVLKDTGAYFIARKQHLNQVNLVRIHRFIQMMRQSSLFICLIFIGLSELISPSMGMKSFLHLQVNSSIGLAWMLMVHGLAHYLLLVLLEERAYEEVPEAQN